MESLESYETPCKASRPEAKEFGLKAAEVMSPRGQVLLDLRFGNISRHWFLELMGYALVSAVALGADTFILADLVSNARWSYVPASAVSFTIGATIAYLLSTRFVFGSRRVANRLLEFGLFVALGILGLGVNTVVLWITHGIGGLGLVVSKMVAAVCTFATNFLLRHRLLFSSSGKEVGR